LALDYLLVRTKTIEDGPESTLLRGSPTASYAAAAPVESRRNRSDAVNALLTLAFDDRPVLVADGAGFEKRPAFN
jgi:hypothetical protein